MVKYISRILIALFWLGLSLAILIPIPENNNWLAPDTFFHLGGGVIAAWLVTVCFNRRWSVILAAMLIGILWEVAEHASSYFGSTYWPLIASYFYGGSLIDTASDLIADLVGAIGFVLLYYRNEK